MSIADQMERKRVRLREIRRDMDGMSPKLGLWQKLKAEALVIQTELQELGQTRVRTHMERIQKHQMDVNTIYIFMEEGNPTAKALAENDECYAIQVPYDKANVSNDRQKMAIEMVANSLYDVQQGGDGYGGASRPVRPPHIMYPVVALP